MKKLENVILVDDNTLSNYVTELILKQHNPDVLVEIQENGLEAIPFIEQLKNKKTYVMLLDINMPKMNGVDFLDWYQSNDFNKEVKIVMFTTSIRQEDIKPCLAYEAVMGHIEKPLSLEKIKNLLEKLNT